MNSRGSSSPRVLLADEQQLQSFVVSLGRIVKEGYQVQLASKGAARVNGSDVIVLDKQTLARAIGMGKSLESALTRRYYHPKGKKGSEATRLGVMRECDVMLCLLADKENRMCERSMSGYSNKTLSSMWHAIDMARISGANSTIRVWLSDTLGKRGRSVFLASQGMDVPADSAPTPSLLQQRLVDWTESSGLHRDTGGGMGEFRPGPLLSVGSVFYDARVRMECMGLT